ncbi:MAG: TrkH family potassium uptake protein [Brevinema sp.]
MFSILYVLKIISLIRITILSITMFYLIQGIFLIPIKSIPLLFSILFVLIVINIITDQIKIKILKYPQTAISMFAAFFWIIFIKTSHLEIFIVDNTYHIQSLLCSISGIFFGIYLYQNCYAVFEIFSKIKIGSRLLVLFSFLIVIAIGTALLMLPIAVSNSSLRLSPIDAFFTAVSAVCVTGLTVVDTATVFSNFGQIVILALIQIGALGLVTITTVFLTLLGRKLSVTNQISAKDNSSSSKGDQSLTQFLGFTLGFTMLTELIIAIIMFIRFYKLLPLDKAIFYSIFHAVSAFCNAGFSLFSDSMITFRGDWIINIAIMSAIIIGGMGFSVWHDIFLKLSGKKESKQLKLQSIIALRMSLILTLLGALLFYITEISYTLEFLPLKEKILSSFFASVNLRTAGFNTVDLSSTGETSRLISLVLMYIGASPGSTGGGIKTTTFLVLYATFKSIIKNDHESILYGRRIEQSIIPQAWALIFNSLAWITIVSFLICYVERLPLSAVLYETFSAYATVGVSTGITPHVTNFSKILLSITMILGRVGPTTIMLALLGKRGSQKSLIKIPTTHLSIG